MFKNIYMRLSLLSLFSLFLASCGGGGGGGGGDTPCSDYEVGESCGGGIFAGYFNDSYSLIVTPGNCTDSPTPVCDGATDAVVKQWASGAHFDASASSLTDGRTNTNNIIVTYTTNAPAANYCNNLIYNGFDDWYLPAINELLLMYNNRLSVGGFDLSGAYYWASTEFTFELGYRILFSTGVTSSVNKNTSTVPTNHLVRCVRRSS